MMRQPFLKYFILFIFFAYPFFLKAQSKRGNVAIIGNGVAIDFNQTPNPLIYSVGNFNTNESTASICDNDGKLMFYTNGVSVWNREYKGMQNGSIQSPFNPTTSTQALIVPMPQDPFLYYIFTPGYQGEPFLYSMVDMRYDNGRGDVVLSKQILYGNSTEKAAVIKHSNNKDIWLVTHEYGTNSFRTYLIDADGINLNYVVSSVGLAHRFNTEVIEGVSHLATNTLGYLKPSHDGTHLACAIDGDMGTLELFRFDNQTGIVSSPWLLNSAPSDGSYGVEFSPDNSKLYMSCVDSKHLYQYDLSLNNETAVKNSKTLIASPVKGALQLAPDGKIYCASKPTGNYLSRIDSPDALGSGCNFVEKGLDLSPKNVYLGLPEFFIPSIDPEIIYEGYCPMVATAFELIRIKSFESIEWNFGDLASDGDNLSSEIKPKHIYKQAGNYKVSIVVKFADQTTYSYSQRVSILPAPTVTLGPDRFICDNFVDIVTAQIGGGSRPLYFNWNNGTDNSLSIYTHQTDYWLNVTDGICSARDSLHITYVAQPSISLSDTTLCEGQALKVSLPEEYQYKWNDNSTVPEKIFTKTGNYSVTASNKCGSVKEAFSISVIPALKLPIQKDTTLCPGQSIKVNVSNPYGNYLWQDGATDAKYTASSAGRYNVKIHTQCESRELSFEIVMVDLVNGLIPNVITPNGDGFNETFVVDMPLGNTDLKIYNRWGDLIYRTANYDNSWNGHTYPSGMYFYQMINSCKQTVKGWLQVIR